MEIKLVTTADILELQKISYRTFDDTFREMNSPENIKDYLDTAFTQDKLRRELEDPHSNFYFLYDNDKIVGYLKLNEGDSQTEQVSSDCTEIERLYILKNYHGYGYGKKLLNFAIKTAVEDGKKCVWLGVWEKNEQALGFYKHLGFKKISEHDFMMGNDRQTDLILAYNIE